MLLLGTAAWTQEVRFISPQNGATIRGVVNLQATKTNPDDGWMSYKIGAVGKEAVYVAAVIKPLASIGTHVLAAKTAPGSILMATMC